MLVLMVATAGQAESVLYGPGQAAAALKPGSVVLLMATVGPDAVEDWATRIGIGAGGRAAAAGRDGPERTGRRRQAG